MFGVLRWVVIVGFLLATLVPFYYMIMLSVRPIEDLLLRPELAAGADFGRLHLRHVRGGAEPGHRSGGQGFLTLLGNSAIVASASVLIALAVAIPGAYAVSRLRFFGHRQISALFLMVYLFPAIVIAIPLFVLLPSCRLRGSLIGLVLVYIAQTVPVAIYMLRTTSRRSRRASRRPGSSTG